MKKTDMNKTAGAVMGIMAASAVAAGAYMAMENQKTVKKTVKKVAKIAGNTISDIEKRMNDMGKGMY